MQLDGFKVRVPMEPRFGDTDLLGHVNNAVYLTFFESGRVEYWAQFSGERGFENWPFILARTEIDFLAETFPGDRLTLGIRVSRIGTKSFDLEYLLVRDEDDVPVSRGKSVQVMFDYASKATVPVSDEIRAKLEAFEGRGSLS